MSASPRAGNGDLRHSDVAIKIASLTVCKRNQDFRIQFVSSFIRSCEIEKGATSQTHAPNIPRCVRSCDEVNLVRLVWHIRFSCKKRLGNGYHISQLIVVLFKHQDRSRGPGFPSCQFWKLLFACPLDSSSP